MNRRDALELLHEYTKSKNLIKHALAVEVAMKDYARIFKEDEDLWQIVGLLHDFDYEAYPEEHPNKGKEILEKRGVAPNIIDAIQAHAEFTGVLRDTLLKKAIFAVDELTGFIVAVSLVQPNKSLSEVTVNSVKKKLRQKGFARQVKRDDIIKGAKELDQSLEEHIGNVLKSMQTISNKLEL
ncbi:MAG: HDIG domain-containing metalloprotein [Patescibacteria group bacterium]|nr:HDIG domain-containing protein [Patescibacteria group bacterium]